MKTAMQELEETLKDNLKLIVLNADYELMDKLFSQALEKEKEQIISAYKVGKVEAKMFLELNTTGQQYYNQTYNQN
jgi:hypothetical protein